MNPIVLNEVWEIKKKVTQLPERRSEKADTLFGLSF